MIYEHNTDPSQNFIAQSELVLDAVFLPKTVAVVGAKDDAGSVGRTIMLNMLASSFNGKLYAVNPKRESVFGVVCYKTILDIPEQIELAIIVTPAKTILDVIQDCVHAKVKAAIVISAGFKEQGRDGLILEEKMLEIARRGNLRIIGPNCLGVMNPVYGLNATFARGMAKIGSIAFLSQSGAMCTSVLDWSVKENIGFSAFVSVGSMADVDWGDLIEYLGNDPNTKSILMYMETIGNARSFLRAARKVTLDKPIIVIKPGRTQEAQKAAASHTGSLSGSDEIFDAALKRVGVLRVNSIAELFSMASLLGRQPKPKGPRLAIVTNAGGPSVLATDALIMNGGVTATLSDDVQQKLNAILPAAWSHANPVDILGDADPVRYAKTIEILASDPNNDGILVVLSPQDMTDPIKTAELLRVWAKIKEKPILASWIGGSYVQAGIEILTECGIPTFEYPDDAAKSFALMWKYSQNLKNVYQTPRVVAQSSEISRQKTAKELLTTVQEQRTLLNEYESKKLLNLYGIPIVETRVAHTIEEAKEHAQAIGFPCVIKLLSKVITHKSDIGGVRLNLKSSDEVVKNFEEIQESVVKKYGHEAFDGVTVQKMAKLDGVELILGASVDPQFGPVILFGTGGFLVEVLKDRALSFLPLNAALARQLIDETKIAKALKGYRGKTPVSLELLENIILSFAEMIAENPEIKECDINPLIASSDSILALDARVVLYSKNEDIIPFAIRPYPIEYVRTETLSDGTVVTIRPIRPEDEIPLHHFHKKLSENSIRMRYFEFLSLSERISHERLIRICFTDYDRDISLVTEYNEEIVAVARLSRNNSKDIADLKMIIVDEFHGKTLGSKLVQFLLDIAKRENIKKIQCSILAENSGMIHICKRFGFRCWSTACGKYVFAEKKLSL